jgi:zinc and cadmium transporter
MVGGVTRAETLERLLMPVVSLAAGTLLGGAFFHMLPPELSSVAALHGAMWIVAGFTSFLILEQFLRWHHS